MGIENNLKKEKKIHNVNNGINTTINKTNSKLEINLDIKNNFKNFCVNNKKYLLKGKGNKKLINKYLLINFCKTNNLILQKFINNKEIRNIIIESIGGNIINEKIIVKNNQLWLIKIKKNKNDKIEENINKNTKSIEKNFESWLLECYGNKEKKIEFIFQDSISELFFNIESGKVKLDILDETNLEQIIKRYLIHNILYHYLSYKANDDVILEKKDIEKLKIFIERYINLFLDKEKIYLIKQKISLFLIDFYSLKEKIKRNVLDRYLKIYINKFKTKIIFKKGLTMEEIFWLKNDFLYNIRSNFKKDIEKKIYDSFNYKIDKEIIQMIVANLLFIKYNKLKILITLNIVNFIIEYHNTAKAWNIKKFFIPFICRITSNNKGLYNEKIFYRISYNKKNISLTNISDIFSLLYKINNDKLNIKKNKEKNNPEYYYFLLSEIKKCHYEIVTFLKKILFDNQY